MGVIYSKYHSIGTPRKMAEWVIDDGGTMNVLNPCEFLTFQASVASGGRLVMQDGTFAINNNANVNALTHQIVNNGTLEFPNGWNWAEFAVMPDWSNNKDYTKNFHVVQQSGTVRFGGDFKKESISHGEWRRGFFFDFEGGKLITEQDSSVSFAKCLSAVFPGEDEVFAAVATNASVEVETLAGSTLDMTLFTYGDNAALTKSGAGTVKFQNLPATLGVIAGTVEFDGPVTIDASRTFSDGVTIVFGSTSNCVTVLANADKLNYTLATDKLNPGDVLFTADSDPAILNTILSRLTDLPTGLKVVNRSGKLIVMRTTGITITPRVASVRVGDEAFGAGYTVTGLESGETLEDVTTGTAVYGFGIYDPQSSEAGEYTLTVSGFSSDKVDISYVSSKLVAVAEDSGEVFYWAAERDQFAAFGDAANWRMDSALTTAATRPPCAADQLWGYGVKGSGDFHSKFIRAELEGNTYTIGGYSLGDDSSQKNKGYDFYLKSNGQGKFTVLSPYRPNSSSTWYYLDDAVLDYRLTENWTTEKYLGCSSLREMLILNNRSLATVYGHIDVYAFECEIDSTSKLIFDKGEFSLKQYSNWSTQDSRMAFQIRNNGTVEMSNGLAWNYGDWGGADQNRRMYYTQEKGSELVLGGEVCKRKVSRYRGIIGFTFNGGKLSVPTGKTASFTNPNAEKKQNDGAGDPFGIETTATVAENATLEVAPAASAILQLTNFIFSANSTLVKTGAGKAVFFGDNLPSAVTNVEGTVSFATPVKSLSAFTLENGTTVEFAAEGNEASAVDNAANVSFTCDLVKVPSGAVILTSDNAALLNTIKTNFKISDEYKARRHVEVVGNQLILKKTGMVLLVR